MCFKVIALPKMTVLSSFTFSCFSQTCMTFLLLWDMREDILKNGIGHFFPYSYNEWGYKLQKGPKSTTNYRPHNHMNCELFFKSS